MQKTQQPLEKQQTPWYRNLWCTIWLTMLLAMIVYSAGTTIYFKYVIKPSIDAEREALQQEKEAYMQNFKTFLQLQAEQYYLQLEEWRFNSPIDTPPPHFDYKEKSQLFRDNNVKTNYEQNHPERQNPINPYIWLVLMFFVMSIATFPVAKRLTKRLKKLQEGVENLGQGNLHTRVNISGNDEVSLLAHSFNASAQQIEQLIQQHKNLLAYVSHELRTPLARLRMSAELAALQAPQIAEDLRIDIKELDMLVEEILLASRLDADPEALRITSFDIFALAAEESARTRAHLEGSSIEVQADETLLRRAIRNLLTNAEKYAPQAPATLTVRIIKPTEKSPEMACIEVADHGAGLSETDRNNVFKPFFRAQNTKIQTYGIGLGLSLTAQIIQRHHGQISCFARPEGSGCIFQFLIPTQHNISSKNQ